MQYFDVARILTTHGLQGEVKVEVITDFPEQRFAVGRKLALKSQPDRSLTIVRSRPFKQGWLLKFTGLDSVEKVENLKSQVLVIDKGQQQKLPAGSYYYHEILNSVVVDQDKNCVLGKIVDIESPGANDIWLVREDSGQEYWLPYIKDVVKKVDVAHKKVYVHLMKGLRDEN